jgi:hypothetical protein
LARYKQLCCLEEVQITNRSDECVIVIVWLYAEDDPHQRPGEVDT